MGQVPKLEDVIAILRAHEAFYRAKGVIHMAVFGSVARGDAGPDSDVDLVIDYDPQSKFSLLTLCGVQNSTADWLGCKVDMLTWDGLKPRLDERVRQEAAHVF
ncbi:nucleotidyltransferase family protein [Paramagnetospirillum magneticum]|uniref:Predicted nucleotidyltransferase n=1 Tax=Paramagnetospirillum magneticum (strain ATCC 700264 / AMB-1) TaxID=342108 RepID=Q2W174_PARM1|nr:nucleotidyltransferase family protein [Paramagnetospirillum magneticum]BAE52401.1 Predicted nucleotidyltransferase [Paramagnetospirillum magneticum AMB-1]